MTNSTTNDKPTTKGFGSDNHATVHPQIIEAIVAANIGHMPSYGTDPISEHLQTLIKQEFGTDAEGFIVFNGTAANVTALKALTQPWHSVICTDVAHVNIDECASPEKMAGIKLLACPSIAGKFDLTALQRMIIRKGDQHYAQTRAITITQPTELGTLYSLEELREIIRWAKSQNLLIHMDGARFVNACVSLNCSFKELTTELGIDVLSFGGTKNGLMMGEIVIFMNNKLAADFKYIRKQAAQLPSKTRFIAAQFVAFFENNLWQTIASNSLEKAQELYQKSQGIPGVLITQKPQSNAVFAKIPSTWVKELRQVSFFYVWDENTFECRWMTSWDTESKEIDLFTQKLKELSQRDGLN